MHPTTLSVTAALASTAWRAPVLPRPGAAAPDIGPCAGRSADEIGIRQATR